MTSLGIFDKDSLGKDGLVDLDLDLAWDIDRSGGSSSSEISMISASGGILDLDVER